MQKEEDLARLQVLEEQLQAAQLQLQKERTEIARLKAEKVCHRLTLYENITVLACEGEYH